MRSTYGKKGQTGATAGKTKTMYKATLPDGTVVTKGSFHIHTDTAFMGCYEIHNQPGKWAVSGVVSEPKDWGGQQFVPAVNVQKEQQQAREALLRELVAGVRKHALGNYGKGWDLIVECWEDSDIIAYLDGVKTLAGAIRKIGSNVRSHEERRREAEAEIF